MVVRVPWVRQWVQMAFHDWITWALPMALALVIIWRAVEMVAGEAGWAMSHVTS